MTFDEYKERAEAKWEEYSINVDYWKAKLPQDRERARSMAFMTVREKLAKSKQARARAMQTLSDRYESQLGYKQGSN